jgi:coenzyme F420-reducing hydrogenase delta subunit
MCRCVTSRCSGNSLDSSGIARQNKRSFLRCVLLPCRGNFRDDLLRRKIVSVHDGFVNTALRDGVAHRSSKYIHSVVCIRLGDVNTCEVQRQSIGECHFQMGKADWRTRETNPDRGLRQKLARFPTVTKDGYNRNRRFCLCGAEVVPHKSVKILNIFGKTHLSRVVAARHAIQRCVKNPKQIIYVRLAHFVQPCVDSFRTHGATTDHKQGRGGRV